jgi:nucleotide-binding universal stress UspA family protein
MTFRKILVPLAGIDEDAVAFDAAFLVGSESEAHLEVLHTVPAAAARIGSSSVKDAHESSVKGLRARVRALYRNRCGTFDVLGSNAACKVGLSARLVEAFGSEAELIACHGRLADLIILARPSIPQHAWPNLSLEAALRETGRPVLVVPRPIDELGSRVVIGWNGSAEASRAMAYALPILRGASNVLVVTVGQRIIHPPGPAVVEYLGHHGIAAKSTVVADQDQTDAASFADSCLEHRADLIIMGAFTRQSSGSPVFGSMTEKMIRQVEWPVFMAH